MLVHLRLTTPADLTDPVLEILLDRDWITNVTVDRGSSLKPPGDLVECDAAREKTASLLWKLRHLGLDEVGGIVLTDPVGTPFRAAAELEAAAPGHPDDAVIWEAVEAQAEAGAVPTLSYHLFMVLAVALAAVAVITDSSVLVVGAMVVGPEFSAVAAGCAGIALRRWGLLGRGLRLLVLGFVFAILVVTAAAVLGRALGLVTLDEVTGPRPNTGFIWHPDPGRSSSRCWRAPLAPWPWPCRRRRRWSVSSSASRRCRPRATSHSDWPSWTARRSSARVPSS